MVNTASQSGQMSRNIGLVATVGLRLLINPLVPKLRCSECTHRQAAPLNALDFISPRQSCLGLCCLGEIINLLIHTFDGTLHA